MIKTTVLAVIFGIFLRSGHVVTDGGNLAYELECSDTSACYFDLELASGAYLYTSADGTERHTLLVTDSGVYQLGAQTLRIEQAAR